MDWMQNKRLMLVLVIAVWAIIFLPSLGEIEFRGEEITRVMPGKNMLDNGDWMVPRISGEPYYNKPPGINWLVALSFMITGQQNEWAARLPSALSALMFVSLLMTYPAKWLKLHERVIACLIFMTSITMIEKGRMIELEGVVTSMTGIALFYWLAESSNNRNKWLLWLPIGIFVGFGVLVKGPFVPFFFYTAITPVLFYKRRFFKEMFSIQHIVAFAIMSGILAAWYLAAGETTETTEMSGQMWGQLIMRFKPGNVKFGYWAHEVIDAGIINFLPWTLLLPILWNKNAVNKFEGERLIIFKGGRIGLILGFVLMNMMPMTESRYCIPLFCITSILLGMAAMNLIEPTKPDVTVRKILMSVLGLAATASVVLLILVRIAPHLWLTPHTIFASVMCILIFTAALYFRNLIINTPTVCVGLSLVMVTFVMLYQAFGIPALVYQNGRYRPAAAAVNSLVPETEKIYLYHPDKQTFCFYMREPLIYILEGEEIGEEVKYLVVNNDPKNPNRTLNKLMESKDFSSRNPKTIYEFPEKVPGDFVLVELAK